MSPMANEKLPDEAEIHQAVVGIIAGFAKKDPTEVTDERELSADLKIADVSMPFLAMAFRAYVKHFRPKRTIAVAEVRKSKQTVKGCFELVRDRIRK